MRSRLLQTFRCEGLLPGWRTATAYCALAGLLLALWLSLASVLPALIGEPPPGSAGFPARFYLSNRTEINWLGAIWCVAGWFVVPAWRRMSAPQFFARIVRPATPASLSAIRAWTCAILLLLAFRENLASSALLPRVMDNPTGLMQALYWFPIGFEAFLVNETALWAFQCITMTLLFLGVIGLFTRFVVPASAVCYFIFGGIFRDYSFFWHQGLIPVYVLAVLSFTRCGQGWSVDRFWRIRRGGAVPPADIPTAYFGWARYAVWTVIALPYVAAGCSKLYWTGPEWIAADNMRAILLRTTMAMMEYDFRLTLSILPAPDLIFVALGIFGLGSQLVFGLVLVSHRARLVLPALIMLGHIMILFLQNILFLDLILLPLVFYDWKGLYRAARRRLIPRRGIARSSGSDSRADVSGVAEPAHRAGALAVLAIVLFLASWWVLKVEFYPFTAMQMFSKPGGFTAPDSGPGEVAYLRVVAHYADGTSATAQFGHWLPAMGEGRQRPVINDTFASPVQLEKTRQLLNAVAKAKGRRDGRIPDRLEVQSWQWDFANDPDNPHHGVLISRYVHDLTGLKRSEN